MGMPGGSRNERRGKRRKGGVAKGLPGTKPGRRPKGGKAGKRGKQHAPRKSDYFMQPGRGGAVVVLRRPAGNRVVPKICGVMPSRVHAGMLIEQLEKAESVVSDLFLEATDDGIEALEAILAACRTEALARGPQVIPSEMDEPGNDGEGGLGESGVVADPPSDDLLDLERPS